MAGVTIIATISGGGSSSLTGDLDEILHQNGMVRIARHHAGACPPCRDNRDPDNVPVAGCRANVAAEHGHDGYSCQCYVDIVPTDEQGRAITDG